MANSPFKDFIETFSRLLSGIHTGDWLISLATGRKLPDNAPTIAKAAYGLLRGGDEVVLQVLLEKLAEDDVLHNRDPEHGHRKIVIDFLYWLRARGKDETMVSELIAWYYFNGFRIKVAQMHEASKDIKKETVPGKKGKPGKKGEPKEKDEDPTTIETSFYNKDRDGGLMFLRRIAEIIFEHRVPVIKVDGSGVGKPEYDYVPGYEEAVKFLKVSGVPVMPDLSALSELQSTLVKHIKGLSNVAGGVKKRYQREKDSYKRQVANSHPVIKFLMKFL